MNVQICTVIVVAIVNLGNSAGVLAKENPSAVADEVGIDKPLIERIAALKLEFEARDKAVSGELAAARKAGAKGGSKEIKKVLGNYARDRAKIANKVIELIRTHPADPAAFEGILLLRGDFDDDILEFVRGHFLRDPRMGQLCIDLGGRIIDSSKGLLRHVAVESPDRQLRGQATYSLGQYSSQLHRALTSIHRLTDADQELLMTETQRKFYKKMIVDRKLTDSEQEQMLAETQRYFDQVVKDYPDVTSADGSFCLADKARPELVRIANIPGLRAGKVAPNIVGEDLDGRPLNLEEYRGKVVILCFWATWCGPCMEMVPHERELVKRMEGKPFVLLGINADESDKREKARKATRDEQMNWPSFWDGGFNGPIQLRYNVDHYPTLYVLDPGGIIRYIDVRGKDLDRAIDTLLAELEAGSKNAAGR
jgi:thiol-disulfide isomerase/thioredoxin